MSDQQQVVCWRRHIFWEGHGEVDGQYQLVEGLTWLHCDASKHLQRNGLRLSAQGWSGQKSKVHWPVVDTPGAIVKGCSRKLWVEHFVAALCRSRQIWFHQLHEVVDLACRPQRSFVELHVAVPQDSVVCELLLEQHHDGSSAHQSTMPLGPKAIPCLHQWQGFQVAQNGQSSIFPNQLSSWRFSHQAPRLQSDTWWQSQRMKEPQTSCHHLWSKKHQLEVVGWSGRFWPK